MNATTASTIYLPADTAQTHDILRAIECARAAIFDTIMIPPAMLKAMDDPRLCSADIINARIQGALPTLYGMQVHVSRLLDNMPAKAHRKRRNQSWAYHRRIQKKWNKRYGVGPVAVLMNTDLLRRGSNRGARSG